MRLTNSEDDDSCMPWIVLKLGGTSVASAARWQCIEHIVRGHVDRKRRVLVVCSALASVTDRLSAIAGAMASGDPRPQLAELGRIHYELAAALDLTATQALSGDLAQLADWVTSHAPGPVSARDRARLLAHGELLSTRIAAAHLARRGLSVERIDARDLLRARPLVHRTDHFLSASCAATARPEARAQLDASGARVVVTQGFIARDEDGETVLLGRGGSDASAAYLAAAISAEAVEIRSDVPGLFTADPRACPDARLLRRASYAEAETLGALGAKALHPRTIEPLRERGIPLYLGATDCVDRIGTKVSGARAARGVKAVAVRRDLVLLVMARPSQFQPVGFMADVSERFRQRGLSMDLVATSPSEIRATVDLAAFPSAREQLAELLADLDTVCRARVLRNVGSVSLVGSGLLPHGIACPQLLDALGRVHVHLAAHGANRTHVTWVVERDEVAQLAVVAHRALLAAGGTDDVFGPQWEPPAPTPAAAHPSTADKGAAA